MAGKAMKQHFLTMLSGKTPDSFITTTLCGISAPSNGELNGVENIDNVTCKVCRKHYNNLESWRWRRYLERRVVFRRGKDIEHLNQGLNRCAKLGLI